MVTAHGLARGGERNVQFDGSGPILRLSKTPLNAVLLDEIGGFLSKTGANAVFLSGLARPLQMGWQ